VLDIGYKKKDNYKCIWLARVVEMVVIVRRSIQFKWYYYLRGRTIKVMLVTHLRWSLYLANCDVTKVVMIW